MDTPPRFSPRPGEQGSVTPVTDPRLQPTPDYGTLGPGSDIAGPSVGASPKPPRKNAFAYAHLIAVAIGIFGALIAGSVGKSHTSWSFDDLFSGRRSEPKSAQDTRQLDRMKPQKQAETLLEMAVGHSDGAVEQISSRVDRWQGQVQWNSQIATLATAALNSTDMRVRESGVEVELAAYGLAKNTASLDYLRKAADSPYHAQKIWALWALGLIANRGVETGQVVEVLGTHLKDSDVDSRRWAVEGLALTGSDQAIEPLLTTMHDDRSPLVRERAACSLASSGLFTAEQRLSAVPQLLNYTDDPALNAQTRGWAFLALSDITHQRLPNNSAAWRKWYESTGAR
jgi:HEAT repeat protein